MARILVVEDNAVNMRLASIMLTRSGHEVLGAENAMDGIRLAQAHRPDVILMDIQLPDLDGFEATRRLKQDAATMSIPIIAVTAHAMRGDESRLKAAGCDGYLAKPYRRAELLEAIGAWLQPAAQSRAGAAIT